MYLSDEADASPRGNVGARVTLALYLAVLSAIAFWPKPVDGSPAAGRILQFIEKIIPALTHARVEFLANVALFVPLGILLALVLSFRSRYLVLPIVFVMSFTIECIQGALIPERTPSLFDIVANTAGGCLGLIFVAIYEWWKQRVIRNALLHTREYPPPPPS